LRCKQGIECRLLVGGTQLCEIARSIYMYDWQLRVDITSRHAAYHLPLFTGDPAYCTVNMYAHVYWTSTMCVYEELPRPFHSYL